MVIGIGGASRSGKTCLAQLIKEHFSNMDCKIIQLDDYVFPKNQLPLIRDHVDWEDPLCYNFSSLKEDLKKYSHSTSIVIIEGFLIYHDKEIVQLCDLRFFIQISKTTFFARKDTDLRWGKEPFWYQKHIWHSYIKYGLPEITKQYSVISGEMDFDHQHWSTIIKCLIP